MKINAFNSLSTEDQATLYGHLSELAPMLNKGASVENLKSAFEKLPKTELQDAFCKGIAEYCLSAADNQDAIVSTLRSH
jgi:hypothetical protein